MAHLIGSFNKNNQITTPPGVTFKPMIKASMLPKTDTGGATLIGSFNDNTISTPSMPQLSEDVGSPPISGGVFPSGDTEFEKMSGFQKFLDVIGRPGYGVKALISQIQRETAQGIPIDKPEIKKRFEAFWRGLSGQERLTANQLWEQRGVSGVPLLGFATEIATDPLMYGGYQAVTKGITRVAKETLASVARKAPTFIGRFPAVGKVVGRVEDVLAPAGKLLRETFTTKSSIPGLSKTITKYLDERQYATGKQIDFGIKVNSAIKTIAKKTGKSIDDINKEIINYIEKSPATPNIVVSTPEVKLLANTLKDRFTNILMAERQAGVKVSQLSGELGYFPRVISKQSAKDYLYQATVGGKKVWSNKLANSLRRKTGDFTMEEFNKFVATEGLPSLGGKTAEGFFSINPGYVTALRGIRSTKAVTSAKFLNEGGQIFGRSARIAPEGWVALPDSITKLNPSLKGKVFDPEVAKELERVTVSYFNQAPIKDFLKVFDAVQNTWKRWTLAIFPKYHMRNAVGNTWNNYLAGVDPKYYAQAANLQKNPHINQEIITLAQKHGVLGKGWYAADIERAIEKQVAGKWKGFTGKGMEVGTVIENNARLAHFMDKLGRGLSPDDAAQSVKKYLFDYSDLTAFEKQVMKRVMPFYTWTRKNVPLQLEMLWKKPQKFAVTTPALRNRENADLLRLKLAQPSLYERFPIEFGRTKEAVAYVALEGLLPMGDLTKIFRPDELLTELASPYLRTPIELKMNMSFYTERQIQKYNNETQEILKLELPVKMQYLLANLLPMARLVGEITRATKKKRTTEELTPGQRVFNFVLAKVYNMDTKDLKARAIQKIERDIRELEIGLQRAKSIGREREVERIMKTIKQATEIIKDVK